MADNTDQVVVIVALTKKKGKIYKIKTLVIILYMYFINTLYWLLTNYYINLHPNSDRQYRSSCCHSGINKEKKKRYIKYGH